MPIMGKHHSGNIGYDTCVAYYRNALLPERAAQVRAYLEAHPDTADHARIDADHEHAIAQSLDGILQEPIPPRLQIKTRSTTRLWSGRLALVATIVLSTTVGWWLGGLPTATDSTTAFTKRVVSAARQPVKQASIQTVAHAPIEVSPPDLALQGYQLVRQQRLDNAPSTLVEFVYRSASGDLLRIYAETEPGQHTVPTVTSRDGISLAQWRDGDTRYALVGNMPELSLQTLAKAAQTNTAGSGHALANAEQLRVPRLGNGKPDMTLQPVLPSAEQVVPATAHDDYVVQPARM